MFKGELFIAAVIIVWLIAAREFARLDNELKEPIKPRKLYLDEESAVEEAKNIIAGGM
jgi:hypothetical protein